jgi:hypothetical protein
MKFVADGSSKANPGSLVQGPVIALVSGLLGSVLVLGWALSVNPRHQFPSSISPITAGDLPPYWGWLEAGVANASQTESSRAVYAYSVIPGGVMNAKELQLALAHDPIAAVHYTGFHSQAARPIRLTKARRAYVSYRVGSHIYWTTERVTLHAGETLLSDGTHLVRSRCGNRISEVPATPTSASEPAMPVLNPPALTHNTVDTTNLPPAAPIWFEQPEPSLVALAPSPSSPASGNGPFPLPLPFFPCCGGGPGPHPPKEPPTPPGPPPVIPPPSPSTPPPAAPPVATPEPTTVVLLAIGLLGALVLTKRRS